VPSPPRHRLAIAALVLFTAGAGFAAEPAKKDEAAKLDEYQVGGNKKLPKEEGAVAKVERPKGLVDTGFELEKPTIEIAPMVVAPMQVSAPPPVAAAVPLAKPAASKPVTKPASTPSPAAGATAALPVAPKAAPAASGAPPQSAGGEVALVPISTPAPEYPREAAINGTTGYVVVAFTLNVDGEPQDINIIESSPPRVFDQSARRAVARWRFQPVVINGHPAERKVQRRIDFK
jgi:protein TonB